MESTMAKNSMDQLLGQLNGTPPKGGPAADDQDVSTDDDGIEIDADTDDADDADDGADGDSGAEKDGNDAADDKDDAEDEVDEDALPDPVKAILKKNRDEVRDAQKEIRRLKRELRDKPDDSAENKDANERADKFQKLYVKRAAVDALREAGLSGKPDRFLRMLDLDTLEVDEDGQIDGLDEQVEEIKADFEDLFVKEPVKAPRRRISGDGAPRDVGPVPKSSTDLLVNQLMGR
jgi:hypothetical protein